MTEWN
jgi:hypothetical protein